MNIAASFRQGERLTMSDVARDLGSVQVLVCSPDGTQLSSKRDARAYMSAASDQSAGFVAIPVER
jgi:hypothetical protein